MKDNEKLCRMKKLLPPGNVFLTVEPAAQMWERIKQRCLSKETESRARIRKPKEINYLQD